MHCENMKNVDSVSGRQYLCNVSSISGFSWLFAMYNFKGLLLFRCRLTANISDSLSSSTGSWKIQAVVISRTSAIQLASTVSHFS